MHKIYIKKKKNSYFIISYFIIGIINGFIPCSIVYIAISIAISIGNFFLGGVFMFYFGLGTVPIMFTTFSIGNFYRKKILLNNITLILGILLLIRGLVLGIPYLSPLESSLFTKKLIFNYE
ncbi:urease accessory protein UreH domain-containing protein [Candidatus Karelsulcia muelleri]|uniref:Urease accessory protein UreH-like transmembrane domain-containing protein n=1 Tax=Candidatus Karelsulcia muelleri TaxID=336810 RepID=A0A3A1MMI9_9FLAO|nr:sulfite exporter TauE/SafE family protein [Candidatus Karelsulcia muelleri]RIU86173.1 hypothetical protein D2A33_00720 [Candidatus Karelsulcia muelleri]